jgi:hypothetical protein
MKLPLDRTDYLQPRSSAPVTYLDLADDDDRNSSDEEDDQQLSQQKALAESVDAIGNPEYFGVMSSGGGGGRATIIVTSAV